jgi:hypothetical protein
VSEPPNAAVLVVDDVPENRSARAPAQTPGHQRRRAGGQRDRSLAAIERKNFDPGFWIS